MALLNLPHARILLALSDNADVLEGGVSIKAALDDFVVHGARQQLHLEIGFYCLRARSDGHGVSTLHVDHELVRIGPLDVREGSLGQLRPQVGQQDPAHLLRLRAALEASAVSAAFGQAAHCRCSLWMLVHKPRAEQSPDLRTAGDHGQEVCEVPFAALRRQRDGGVPVPLREHEGPDELPQRVPELAADLGEVDRARGAHGRRDPQLDRQDLLLGRVRLPERGREAQAQGGSEEGGRPHAEGSGPRLQYLSGVMLEPLKG
mmetsp:Transcript_29492/g.84741  ORF Transcript_29492/g.84741 Transcript_29492/m.84741 type:complete len:261 (+) Transcript_29492:367-1149(+)